MLKKHADKTQLTSSTKKNIKNSMRNKIADVKSVVKKMNFLAGIVERDKIISATSVRSLLSQQFQNAWKSETSNFLKRNKEDRVMFCERLRAEGLCDESGAGATDWRIRRYLGPKCNWEFVVCATRQRFYRTTAKNKGADHRTTPRNLGKCYA